MEYTFFYGSLIGLWMLFLVCCIIRKPRLSDLLIGLITIGYSVSFDTLLGEYQGLYHYINTEHSLLYSTISGIALYPLLNILYTMFLPKKKSTVLVYTVLWIAAMLLFELASLYAKTIVLTGWNIWPWSFVTYIATYAWIYPLHQHLEKRIK